MLLSQLVQKTHINPISIVQNKGRVSSGMVAQKNRKNSKLCIKNRKIKSTSVDRDSFPAPHKGYNKGYESSDSMFTGFRSTFAAKKEWKWSVTFSLLTQLRCIKSEWHDWLQVERGFIIKGDHIWAIDSEAMRARGIIVLVKSTSWSKISRIKKFYLVKAIL